MATQTLTPVQDVPDGAGLNITALLAAPTGDSWGSFSAYATLAFGSACALFLYPHSITGILSSSSGRVVRRNAAMLPGYSFMLGLLALFGFFAIAAGVDKLPEFAGGFKLDAQLVARAPGLPAALAEHDEEREGCGGCTDQGDPALAQQ